MLSGSCHKQKNSDFGFSNPHLFLKMSKFVAGHVTKIRFLKMNTNFALKLQGNVEKMMW